VRKSLDAVARKAAGLMELDPSHYQIAVQQHSRRRRSPAEVRMRRVDAARRADMDNLVVSQESRDNASQTAPPPKRCCSSAGRT